MIDYNEYTFTKMEITLFIIIFTLFSAIDSILFYHKLVFSFVNLIFLPISIKKVKQFKVKKRKAILMEEFKDLLFNMASLMATNYSLRYSLKKSKDVIENIYGDRSVLIGEIDYMYGKMEYTDDVVVLKNFAKRANIEDVYDFVEMYETCKYTGANMVLAMNKASRVIIDKMTIEKEINEIINRKKKEGIIILMMPMAVLLFLNICAADYINVLYINLKGNIIMTIVLISYLLVYKLVDNITSMKV